MDAKRSLVHNWIMKARRDLLSAKKLARGKEPYLDTAIYHCQQVAEKVIKGWLVYHDVSFEKTHDLRLLVTMASEVEPKFTAWFDVAEQVTPYATAYRYPGEVLEPTEKEFLQALNAVGALYEFVCSLLPAELSAL
jgi:HEPN domain-containing protein